MGFRFWKRVRLAPGVTLNLSQGGASVSVGPPGAKLTVGSSGARVTLGVPGTGLYWTQQLGSDPEPSRSGKPVSPTETAWNDGVTALLEERLPEAVERLAVAWNQRALLTGRQAVVEVPLTPELVLALAPDERGAGLAYAEALQAQGRIDDAVDVLRILRTESDAPVVRVALAELELERGHADAALAVCGRSKDPVVGLYRARALLAAGRPTDALDEVEKTRLTAPRDLADELDEVEAAARAAS